jgi:ABC-type glycerol-3-phosphate transport system substrate-binding protein
LILRRKRMKRCFVAALVGALCLMAAACNRPGSSGRSGASGGGFKSSSAVYGAYDLAEPVKLYIYMVGTVPEAMDEIVAKANGEYFGPILNTTVEFVFIPWSDTATKYALILAGGDDVDIIFTAPWEYYEQEAAKGSFLELSDDFVEQWMPVTAKEQSRISWLQTMTRGKIYAAPSMYAGDNYKLPAIREDLRIKHGLPEPDSWDAMERFLFTIAKNENGIQGYAAAGTTWEVMNTYFECRDALLTEQPVYFVWMNDKRKEPAPEDLSFLYFSDVYRDYALEMKQWMEMGVWSRNVMNNTISPNDGFMQGTSATVFWNDTIYSSGETMEKNGIGTAGYYDLSPQSVIRRMSYNNNCWAITSSSEYPGRAGLALDLMKTNVSLVNLLKGGVEGRHYLDQGDGKYLPGPEAAKYSWNSWAWALDHPRALQLAWGPGTPPQRITITESKPPRIFEPKIDGFRVDMSGIAAEWAVISALIEEYRPSLECGAFGANTEAKLAEFQNRLRTAGADKVVEQFRSQYAAFMAAYN